MKVSGAMVEIIILKRQHQKDEQLFINTQLIMSTFNSIRSQALSLENQTSGLLSKYSGFAVSTTASPTSGEVKLDKQIESILQKRDDLLNSLTRIADSDSKISTVKLQQLSRHKEILQENWSNFAGIRSTILQERNKLNLLFSVKTDIDKHAKITEEDEMGYINDEQRRVNSLNNIADDLINRAYETRESLLGQRNMLNNAGNRIFNTLSTVPGINVIISKINTRRKRDAIILASLISICILFLFFTH